MKSLALVLALVVLVFTGCASREKAQTKIEKKITLETGVTDGRSLGRGVREMIHDLSNLDSHQKKELELILDRTAAKGQALSEKSFKLKSVLIKELLSGKVESSEVGLLKRDIRQVEKQRLKLTFETIGEISRVVEGDPDAQALLQRVFDMEHSIR